MVTDKGWKGHLWDKVLKSFELCRHMIPDIRE